jgi:hypothetical protein
MVLGRNPARTSRAGRAMATHLRLPAQLIALAFVQRLVPGLTADDSPDQPARAHRDTPSPNYRRLGHLKEVITLLDGPSSQKLGTAG